MTVALSDTQLLTDMLRPLPTFKNPVATAQTTSKFYTQRKPLSATINTLANALYQVISIAFFPNKFIFGRLWQGEVPPPSGGERLRKAHIGAQEYQLQSLNQGSRIVKTFLVVACMISCSHCLIVQAVNEASMHTSCPNNSSPPFSRSPSHVLEAYYAEFICLTEATGAGIRLDLKLTSQKMQPPPSPPHPSLLPHPHRHPPDVNFDRSWRGL